MKINGFISYMALLAVLFSGCSVNVMEDDFEVPSTSEHVRLQLRGGDDAETAGTRAVWNDVLGDGNLKFRWDRVDEDSEDLNRLSLILSDGENPVSTSSGADNCLTSLMVTPDEKYPNVASFESVEYYLQEELDKARYCYAVAGGALVAVDPDEKNHLFRCDIPAEFTQEKSQDPSFLREYMHMYATTPYDKDDLSLSFKHLPATFRFIVTNRSTVPSTLESVSIYLSEPSGENPGHVSSCASYLKFDWTEADAEISYDGAGHNVVTTSFSGDDTSLDYGERYIAYSMTLPLPDGQSFEDKVLNFSVRFDGSEEFVVPFDAEVFASRNGGIYNWVGGRSYTVKLDIGTDPVVSGEILADNTIEINTDLAGEYTLMYEGADGLPLEDYAEICTLTVEELEYYEDFIDVNVAPREAESIGIYDSSMKRMWCIFIEDFKPSYTEPLYSFGLLSDIHLVPDNKVNCLDNFQHALEFLNGKGIEFICHCGDISEHGTEEEFALFKQMVTTYSADVPVYTTTGNHDCQYEGINPELWMQYTGHDLVFEFSRTLPGGDTDHFLFLGMSYWRMVYEKAYLKTNIQWLEAKLNQYSGERCFVFTHLFFPDRAGNLNHIYPERHWLTGVELQSLQGLCDRYLNSFWFSGHSHWKWSLQKYEDWANVFRVYEGGVPASGWCVHVPSCSKPQDSNGLSSGEKGSRVEKSEESEGAIVHVYDDHIDIFGIDFKADKYLPIATYRLTSY